MSSIPPTFTSTDRQIISVKPISFDLPERGDALQVRATAPLDGTDLPVIVSAHGFGESMIDYDPLVDHWTANGFVVIQPTFLDSRTLGVTPADARYSHIWRTRVDDLEFVIDHLDAIVATVPGLVGRVDLDRIAVVGHSWGGQSVGMLLGARVIGADDQPGEDRTHPRVRAGVLLANTGIDAGDLVPFARENFAFMRPDFGGLKTPTLVVAGDHDQSRLSTRGPDWFADVYFQSPGVEALLTLFGAEHSLGGITGYNSTETTDESPETVGLIARMSTAFLQRALGIDAAAWTSERASLDRASSPIGSLIAKAQSED